MCGTVWRNWQVISCWRQSLSNYQFSQHCSYIFLGQVWRIKVRIFGTWRLNQIAHIPSGYWPVLHVMYHMLSQGRGGQAYTALHGPITGLHRPIIATYNPALPYITTLRLILPDMAGNLSLQCTHTAKGLFTQLCQPSFVTYIDVK